MIAVTFLWCIVPVPIPVAVPVMPAIIPAPGDYPLAVIIPVLIAPPNFAPAAVTVVVPVPPVPPIPAGAPVTVIDPVVPVRRIGNSRPCPGQQERTHNQTRTAQSQYSVDCFTHDDGPL
jgi:hypothetical protein